jgi:hydroxylamine dehydrogenase
MKPQVPHIKVTFSIFLFSLLSIALAQEPKPQSSQPSPKKTAAAPDNCVDCHKKETPSIVADWQASLHSKKEVSCKTCHGEAHKSMHDGAKAALPSPEVCGACHSQRLEQFKKGKHAQAWLAMKIMPTFHSQPVAMTDGMKGCGGCHRLGLKNEDDLRALKAQGSGFGLASCDVCHTRHSFSVKEARQPQACQTCHMGFDHPQWEMYSSSKHGVRYLLKQSGKLPESTPAPTCQTCHMQKGDHEVRTAWGFLAVKLPMPEDTQWAADQGTIMQALGLLDPQWNPTARVNLARVAQIARLNKSDWQKEREKMLGACKQCHSATFAYTELLKGDEMIQVADNLLAEGIRVVSELYKDNLLIKPDNYKYPLPDLLTFHDAPSPIEQKLWVMLLEHRMRTFQGTFHNNPDYALWYGWSELKRDLTEIRAMAAELRKNQVRK